MDINKISAHLDQLLGYEIRDWEREDLALKLASMKPAIRAQVFRQLPVIWPVSYALFFAFVDQVDKAAACLHPSQFPSWVHAILDVYESKGLRQAQLFMAEVEEAYVCRIRGETGLTFNEVKSRLIPFAASIADHKINLAPAQVAYTDTETIFLPLEIITFRNSFDNFTLYKLTTTFMVGLCRNGTFSLDQIPTEIEVSLKEKYGNSTEKAESVLTQFFSFFPDRPLAVEIFYHVEAIRILKWIAHNFPGLIKDWQSGCREIIHQTATGTKPEKNSFVHQLRLGTLQCILSSYDTGSCRKERTAPLFKAPLPNPSTITDSLALTVKLYEQCQTLPGHFTPPASPLPFMGRIVPDLAYKVLKKRRKEQKDRFIKAFSVLLTKNISNSKKHEEIFKEKLARKSKADSFRDGSLLLNQQTSEPETQEIPQKEGFVDTHITIDEMEQHFDQELQDLSSQIRNDLGRIPSSYISSAVGLAGGSPPDILTLDATEDKPAEGPILYDEWDYRRAGFRKNWCSLQEKEVVPVGGTFIENTLSKYKGQLINLRRQFELMQTQECFLRRQKDGNEIDLDAAVEAVSDLKANLSPTENLFIRLRRDQRNIASLFLVDMSSSTEGWINTALKESLLLMCEALAMLGDSYAIYGFSGMRRTRCEFFCVKEFDTFYDTGIKEKIAAIKPTEYTRMGPAIRHAAVKLGQSEARTRLLITLSDGKPEDYDDYKGVYAIEDTRHALIEAKAQGIHPFCITVDRKAHDYMAHLYGEVNYIFIDDVKKLPKRIPEIYRNLTS